MLLLWLKAVWTVLSLAEKPKTIVMPFQHCHPWHGKPCILTSQETRQGEKNGEWVLFKIIRKKTKDVQMDAMISESLLGNCSRRTALVKWRHSTLSRCFDWKGATIFTLDFLLRSTWLPPGLEDKRASSSYSISLQPLAKPLQGETPPPPLLVLTRHHLLHSSFKMRDRFLVVKWACLREMLLPSGFLIFPSLVGPGSYFWQGWAHQKRNAGVFW